MLTQKPLNAKIAEKLTILRTRLKSVLIQVHYLKNTLLNENGYFPKLCSNSSNDAAIKLLIKKFPNNEIKINRSILEPLMNFHTKILQELNFHYNTLVDVLEVKDHLIDLLGQISAFQYFLDITLNTEMTRLYLDLVTDYSCAMIMLSGITPQIRLILALYNLAFNCKFDQDENVFFRLCDRLVDKHKDGCLVELSNEVSPFSKMLLSALGSVIPLISTKLLSIKEWDEAKTFQLSQSCDPSMHNLFSLERVHRWLLLGYLVLYPEILRTPTNTQIFRLILEISGTINIFRDEKIQVHKFITNFCSSQKGLSKLASLVKETQKDLFTRCNALHRGRRNYLRLVMRHQLQVLVDQPGIIAPNIGILCHTVSIAYDEVHWLITHCDQPPSKKTANIEWYDPQFPEFIYQLDEIRHLMQQYDIVSTYYKKVLINNDLPLLETFIVSLKNLCNNEVEILNYFIEKLKIFYDQESSEVKEEGFEEKKFKGIRLDWLRLQTFLSCQNTNFSWWDNIKFVTSMNQCILHTHFVDNFTKFLDKLCSLKFLYFHQTTLKELFDSNLKLAAQHRYIIIFPRICAHFLSNCKSGCPEDFNQVLRATTVMANTFLFRICQELCQVMATIIKSQFDLSLKSSQPINAIDLYHFHIQKKQKDAIDSTNKRKIVNVDFNTLPGSESRRTNVEINSQYDLELATLSQLAVGLNSRPIVVNNCILNPAVYLKKEIVKFLNDKLVILSNIKLKRDKHEIIGARRCSDMKQLIMECMSVITRISEYVNINVSVIFMDVFLSQSLYRDNQGRVTLTEIYTNWYLDMVLNQPYILHSPLFKCFLTITPHSQKEAASILIKCEEFTDVQELQALAEIIGPYGMRHLNERIMLMIIKNICALRRFVQRNRPTLIELNVLHLDFNKIKKLIQTFEDVDDFCLNWKQMGILFAFKDLCREAIKEVTRRSIPFLKASVNDLQQDIDSEDIDNLSSVSESETSTAHGFKNQLIINELCQGFGLKTKIDSTLFSALDSIKLQQQQIQAAQQENVSQNEELQNELLMVATSYLLPRLVGTNFYHVEYEALDDNIHCVAYAIKELTYAFFSRYGEERLVNEIRKFIALTSSNLLRLGLETNQSNKEETLLINNRDSIYIFFDFVIQTLENVSDDFYEECFPYALVRQAYHNVVKQSRQVITNAAHPTDASTKAALEASKIDQK